MDRTELIERARHLADGYKSGPEAFVLVDAAIELCSVSGSRWEARQVSHAIAMTGLGLWRAVGAAIVEAFGNPAESREPIGEEVTITMLRQMRALLEAPAEPRRFQ